jgi:hypothetical protein
MVSDDFVYGIGSLLNGGIKGYVGLSAHLPHLEKALVGFDGIDSMHHHGSRFVNLLSGA